MNPLTIFKAYRKLRGGKWALTTGLFWGRNWTRVPETCVERVDESWPYFRTNRSGWFRTNLWFTRVLIVALVLPWLLFYMPCAFLKLCWDEGVPWAWDSLKDVPETFRRELPDVWAGNF